MVLVYIAFGNERNPDPADTNPFRYCAEYYDLETGTYYLRARYYQPLTGRFLAEDTHWHPSNMIYGDNPVKWNKRETDPNDPLGLNTYTYVPDITAIMQSGNLYVYAMNNPQKYIDPDGEIGILAAIAIGAGVGALVSGGIKIFNNVRNGEKWSNGVGKALLAGGVAGAIAVIPIPGVNAWVSVAVMGATGNVAGSLIAGEVKNIKDVGTALSAGAVAGLLGKGAADILTKGVTAYFGTLNKAQQKAFLSEIGKISNSQLRAIRREVAAGLTPDALKKLVDKYGYGVIVSAFVSSTTADATK